MQLKSLTQRFLPSGVLAIAVCSVASRFLGLLRDRLLAGSFGAGPVLDAYYAAFKIPDFIFNTFVLGALAAALVPTYVRERSTTGPGAAQATARSVFLLLSTFLTACTAVAAVWAPQVVSVLAPGFPPETAALTVSLTRVMLLSVVVFGASNVVSCVLQAERAFLAFSLAPVLYNVGIILGLLTFVRWFGPTALGWGVVLGSLLHLGIQLPALYRTGLRWSWSWHLTESVRRVARLLAPRTLGLAAASLGQLITARFVSHLATGSVAAFSLATNLQSFPINVFGVSLAVAALPVLSQAYSDRSPAEFGRHFSRNVRRIVFFVLPLAVLYLVLRAHIVRVVLGSGAFNWADTIRTAQVLGFLALAMVSDSLVPLVARGFYAIGNTWYPALAGGITVTVNTALLMALHPYGLAGVGIAYVSASLTNLGLLLLGLARYQRDLGAAEILAGIRWVVPASLAAGAVAYAVLHLAAGIIPTTTFLGVALNGGIAGAAGLAAYLWLGVRSRVPEAALVRRWLPLQR